MDSTQWQSFLKSCLDILRNGSSKFDGLKAINEFITLITLKLTENRICNEDEEDSDENYNIPIGEDCKISNLYNEYCTPIKLKDANNAKKLFDIIYNKNRIFDIIQEFDDDLNVISETRTRNLNKECVLVRFNSYTSEHLSRITKNTNDKKTLTSFDSIHAKDVQQLIIKIYETFNTIESTIFNYDAFGEAYEKMVADELGNSSKRYGQYFTKRDLIELIINELDIKQTDKCYDPACGTGGFLLGFAKKYKDNKDFINNNICGQEILEEVHMTMAFNMLAYNIDGCLANIKNGDSIDELYHLKTKELYDVVGANPPFGMSLNCDIKEYPIIVKDSVALFLQHIYFSLKNGGKAGIVIDRGILNNGTDKKNSWEGRLRKFLLENTEITKIINLPTGIFKHTNFATSVIFFTKGKQTTNIKYILGYFKDEDKGKGDKTLLLGNEEIITYQQIKKNNYSLKYDDYFKEKEIKHNMKEWIRLGDVCKLERGKIITVQALINGEYPVIGGGQKPMGYHDKFNRKEKCILISGSGSYAGYISRNNNKVYASDCFSIESNILNEDFLYYYLKLNQENIYKLQHGNGQPHVNTNDMINFLIPNLSIEHQEEIINFLDEIYIINKIEDTLKYLKDYPIFNLLINRDYEGFKTIMWYQNNIPQILEEKENISKKKNLYIQSLFNSINDQSKIMRLGDIVNIKFGTRITKGKDEKQKDEPNVYPVYGGGDITFYTDKYNRENETIIISRFGVSPKCVRVINGKIFLNDSGMSIHLKNTNVHINYIKNYLYYNQNTIFNNYTAGNAQLNMETNKLLREFKIPIPSLEVQEQIINKINQLNNNSSHYEQYSKILDNELKLIEETINNMTKLKLKRKKEIKEIPNYDDLLDEFNKCIFKGKKLLNKLNFNVKYASL